MGPSWGGSFAEAHVIQAQRLPDVRSDDIVRDADVLSGYLTDESGQPPGTAAGLVRVSTEGAAAAILRETGDQPVLVQAARSSLTGGAIPHGELVLSIEGMCERGPLITHGAGGRVTAQPGIRLADLQASLAEEGYYFPPVPTYQQAMLGGTVATNAGGAATFKYGVTRNWVHGLRVLLFNGELIAIERGQCVARRGETFHIGLSDGSRLEVPVPDYRLPRIKKMSAGYWSADPLDLVDLFVGSEGTLGLITAITVNVVPKPAAVVTGLVFLEDANLGRLLAAALRDQAQRARERDDPLGPDVRSIEWLDANSLAILRDHDEARRRRVDVPPGAATALLFEMELPQALDNAAVERALEDFVERRADLADGPLLRLFRLLEDHRALDNLEFAFPEDDERQRALTALREAVPTRVNEILAERRRRDPEVKKVGGDLIVPFRELPAMIDVYARGFEKRGLDYAMWGHLSDGNLHPNALPRNAAETRAGFEALLEFAEEAARRGGSPLSEHGVGRSPIKQETLRRFLGDAAIESMRRIKLALDPVSRFAPGAIFPV